MANIKDLNEATLKVVLPNILKDEYFKASPFLAYIKAKAELDTPWTTVKLEGLDGGGTELSYPFIEKPKKKGIHLSEIADWPTISIEEASKIYPPPKKKGKPKQIDQALQELEGMRFTIDTIVSTPTSYDPNYEVRVVAVSPTFGKIVKIEKASEDIHMVALRAKAIIWIWKEAKKRLIEGKFI